MSSSLLQDERVKWLRSRVALALDVPTETFDDYFVDSLERARSAGIARENMEQFLSKKHGNGSTLFFSCNKWMEEIEGMSNI